MTNTELNDVRMTDCEMSHGWFPSCKMTDVTIQRSNLTCSGSVHSMLNRVTFRDCAFNGANWSGVDFRSCELENLSFQEANLEHSNFEELDLYGCQFANAKMEACSMTGTRLRNASLEGARLRFAKLGYVDWEGCNLRNADLSGCLFHLGGSRDGLVGSPYPSHGTRTGFYRDDLEELVFKNAEEVCRARIVHCDLTGANFRTLTFILSTFAVPSFRPTNAIKFFPLVASSIDNLFGQRWLAGVGRFVFGLRRRRGGYRELQRLQTLRRPSCQRI